MKNKTVIWKRYKKGLACALAVILLAQSHHMAEATELFTVPGSVSENSTEEAVSREKSGEEFQKARDDAQEPERRTAEEDVSLVETVSGNSVSENSISENSVSENSAERDTAAENDGMTENTAAETVSENTVEESVSENTAEETVSENTTEESVSENTAEQTVSGNTTEESVSENTTEESVSENTTGENVPGNAVQEPASSARKALATKKDKPVTDGTMKVRYADMEALKNDRTKKPEEVPAAGVEMKTGESCALYAQVSRLMRAMETDTLKWTVTPMGEAPKNGLKVKASKSTYEAVLTAEMPGSYQVTATNTLSREVSARFQVTVK